MNDQNSNNLMSALSTCAAALQSECINKSGVIKVNAPIDERRSWAGPPLKPDLHYADVDLNDFAKFLYKGEDFSGLVLEHMWDHAVEMLFSTRQVAPAVKTFLPEMPVLRSGHAPTAPLIQLMCAGWWNGGNFETSTLAARLRAYGRSYILDQRTISIHKRTMRLPRGCQINPRQILQASTGRTRPASASVSALYRHLITTLPHRGPELNVIFSAAVTAGNEFCMRLTELFHIEKVERLDESGIWGQARRLVREATETPSKALWNLLKSRMSLRTFRPLFGDPSAPPRPYTQTLMTKHVTAIDRIESGEIDLAVKKKTGEDLAAASRLLHLQQLMGPQQ